MLALRHISRPPSSKFFEAYVRDHEDQYMTLSCFKFEFLQLWIRYIKRHLYLHKFFMQITAGGSTSIWIMTRYDFFSIYTYISSSFVDVACCFVRPKLMAWLSMTVAGHTVLPVMPWPVKHWDAGKVNTIRLETWQENALKGCTVRSWLVRFGRTWICECFRSILIIFHILVLSFLPNISRRLAMHLTTK